MFEENPDTTLVTKRRQVVETLKQASDKMDQGFDDICLDSTRTSLGDKGCLLLVRLLKEKPRALRKIQIDAHGIGDKGGQALFEALITDKSIQSLEMGGNNLGPHSMKKCYEMLQLNTTLTFLDLDKNRGLRDTGAKLLGAGLKETVSLKGLCLNGCGLAKAGMIAIAEGLEVNTSLELLALTGNSFVAEVTKAFGEAMKKNAHLKTLSIGGSSKFGTAGARAMADAMKINKTLESLSLAKSGIKDDGAAALGHMLSENKALRSLDLFGNKLGGRGLISLVEGMKINKTLTNLHISAFTSPLGMQLQNLVNFNRAKNQDYMRATFEDVLKDAKASGPLNRTKLMFIGQGKAGKTATVRALLGEPFEAKWKSTVAAALKEAKVSNQHGWLGIPRDERFEFLRDFAANIALNEMEKVERKDKGIEAEEVTVVNVSDLKKNDEPAEPSMMVGTNAAGEEEVMATTTKFEGNEALRSAHRKASADGDGVVSAPIKGYEMQARRYDEALFRDLRKHRDSLKFSIWDYGGQRIFYSLHHLFLTKYGIYVLAFNMGQMLSQPGLCKVYIQFWLNSLALHAPETPLVIVGTFRDEISSEEDFKKISSDVQSVLEKHPFNVVKNKAEKLEFFPISNKDGVGIAPLKQAVYKTACKQPHVQRLMKMGWIYTIEHLLTKHRRPFISITDLKAIASNYKIYTDMEITDMLKTLHDLGLVLHLTQTAALKGTVVLKPQWLISNLGKIIRDEQIHKHHLKALKEEKMAEDVQHLFKDGLVSENLLQVLWNGKQIDYLLDLMKQTLMLSDWDFKGSSVNASDRQYYFVPSLVTGSKDLEEYDDKDDAGKAQAKAQQKEEFLTSKSDTLSNLCCFEFGFLPDGIYDRLVCLCVAHSNSLKSEQPPTVTMEFCQVNFGDNISIKLYENKEVETIFLELVNNQETLAYAESALKIVSSMLQKLKADIIGDGLRWNIFFPKSESVFTPYDEAFKGNLAPWFTGNSGAIEKVNAVDHIDVNKFLEELQEF